MPRKKIDALVEYAKGFGAKGLAYIAINEDGTYKSSFAKFMKDEEMAALVAAMDGKPGDLLLFAADRDNHVNNPEYGILSHIERGEIVVSDRYKFSSLAYQSIGFDFQRVDELNSAFPYPEVVIFIDTPLQSCIDRIDSRGQAKEIYEKLDYQGQVLANYERIFSNLPSGCRLLRIDGSQTRERIFSDIVQGLGI